MGSFCRQEFVDGGKDNEVYDGRDSEEGKREREKGRS